MKRKLQFFLYFMIVMNVTFSIYSIDFKSILISLLAVQVHKTDSYKYSVTNNSSNTVFILYNLDASLAAENKCPEDEKDCLVYLKYSPSQQFYTDIQPNGNVDIYTLFSPIKSMIVKNTSPMANDNTKTLDAHVLSKYRTFHVPEQFGDENSLLINRYFPKKNKEPKQKPDL